jgi:hypothetical protein
MGKVKIDLTGKIFRIAARSLITRGDLAPSPSNDAASLAMPSIFMLFFRWCAARKPWPRTSHCTQSGALGIFCRPGY